MALLRSTTALLFLSAAALTQAEPLIVEGGLSPDGKLAVAVLGDKPAEEVDDEPRERVAYLIEAKSHRIIGPLEEVDVSGGSWGTTRSNAVAQWSPDGRFLAVNVREGRLVYNFVLYQVVRQRAIPQKLPEANSLPQEQIYKELTSTANPGERVIHWLLPTTFVTVEWGLRPRDPDGDFDGGKFGLAGFSGDLEKVFRFRQNHWVLIDLRVPKEPKP